MEFHAHCMDCARFGKSCTDMTGTEPAGSCYISTARLNSEKKEGKHMITEEELWNITQWLKDNVWRNGDIMYEDATSELADIISSLHNLLYEAVTGKRYNYAFHWCNKIGADTLDNIFDDIMKEGEKE